MPITEKQKELRQKHLGSSDMAALFGLDPYRNAYDVWLDKTGQLENLEPNKAMQAGTFFEDGVLQFAEEQLGKIKRNQYRSCKDAPIGSNIDALLIDTGEPVEAKTAGLFGPLAADWGEDNTDQVPDNVNIQSHVHMLCADSDKCHVAAFLGGRGFQLFLIYRNDDVTRSIMDEANRFWAEQVEKMIAPEDVLPHMETLKRIRREPNKVVEVPADEVAAYLEAQEAHKAAAAEFEAHKAKLMALMGDAEKAVSPAGSFTNFEQTRKSYVVKESSYRVLRYKKV